MTAVQLSPRRRSLRLKLLEMASWTRALLLLAWLLQLRMVDGSIASGAREGGHDALRAHVLEAMDVTRNASQRATAVRSLPASHAVRLALLEHDARLWPLFPDECGALIRAAEATSQASSGPPDSVLPATPQTQQDGGGSCLTGLSVVTASLQAAAACVPPPTLPTPSCEDLEVAATAAARLVAACEKAVEDDRASEAAVAEQLRASHEARQAALLQLGEATAGARAQVQDAIAAVARAVQGDDAADIKRAAEQRAVARASAREALEQALAACGGTDIDPTTLPPTDASAYTDALQCLHQDLAGEPPVQQLVQVWWCAGPAYPTYTTHVPCVLCACVCRVVTPAATAAGPRGRAGRRGEGRRPGG